MRYATLPHEKIILATRKHVFTIIPALFFTSLIALVVVSASIVAFLWNLFPFALSFLAIILVLLFAGIASGLSFLSWYYHYYIVTSRKILEVKRIPFLFSTTNDVLLDKVRCTEVDITKSGVLNTMLNIGTITITFDRPTKQEEFALVNIHDPENVGLFLGDTIDAIRPPGASVPVWHKTSDNPSEYRITEEIFPRYSLQP